MILYSVTVNIQAEKEEEYIDWMKNIHIPEIMSTGLFVENKFFRLLQEEEDGGVNFSSQYYAQNMEKLHQYQELYAAELQNKLKLKFGEHYIAFRTILESVD
jgi:hypothetical protein